VAVAAVFVAGCRPKPPPTATVTARAPAAVDTALAPAAYTGFPGPLIVEGVIYELSLRAPPGAQTQVEGFTRLNNQAAVPGGSGSWNVDAYGRLYRDYLIITYPTQRSLGPQVIPANRIISIQFGDGGIRPVP
jgi:hypothetical protein